MTFMEMILLAQIGIGVLFIRYLVGQDRGPKEPKKALIMAALIGAAALPVAIVLESRFISDFNPDGLYAIPIQEIFRITTLVALIEEGAKSIPLLIFLYHKRYFNEMSDGIIYFGITGMTFGVLESVGYSLSYGAGTGVARIIIAPFIHAAFCAVFGWALALYKVRRWPGLIVLIGAMLSVALHALYNFGLFYGRWWSIVASLGLAVILNIGIFVLLKQSRRLDVQAGIATDGENLFCRMCGRPNPERFVFCTSCGKRT